MNMEKVFHMNGASLQKKASVAVKNIIIETIQEVYLSTSPTTLGIAGLGFCSGSNILSIIKDILDTIESISLKILHRPAPEFCVYLNDLPTNDFNSIFKILPEFLKMLSKERKGGCPSIFFGGYPGSFYGKLFPNNSLHFVHCSYSLHWLSRVPPAIYDEQDKPDKSSICILQSSLSLVSQAFCKQFQEDFSLFLSSRSEELVVGGRMVLIFLGRFATDDADRGNSFFLEPLFRSFAILVSKGEIEKEKVDSYDVHFYAPSVEEVEAAVKKEGSFVLEKLELLESEKEQTDSDSESYGTKVAKTVRTVQESMVSYHFGQEILDSLFDNYARLMDEEMAKEDTNPITFAIVARRV